MKFINLLSKILPEKIAYAHCDIPCGIYDPTPLQIAAHTVLRMTQLLDEHKEMHDVARMTYVKEKHGKLVEEEVETLKNDYFKPEHFEKYPELKNLIKEVIELSAKTRQKKEINLAKELVEKCMLVSEIFYKTKNLEPVRVPSGFPTEGEMVTHK